MPLRNRALLVSCCAFALQTTAFAQQPLQDLFETGFMLEDRNQDGVVDFVDAEIVLGADPSTSLIAAAADVAARLGFETLAMDLPLSATGRGVGIAVGASAAAAVGVQTSGLAEDEGIITTTVADGRDWLVVAGRNDWGTRVAATALAGRLPHLWMPDDPTLDEVLADMADSLTEDAVSATSLSVSRIIVREDRVAELAVRVDVPPGQAAMARQRLLSDAPAYEHVEAVVLQIDGAEVRLPRGEMAIDAGPIPARPGSGAKRNLDLGNLFTPDGLLGDADTNSIPDRIDAVLSPATRAAKTVDFAARLGLESAGISVPLVRLPEDIDEASSEPTLVLIGEHPLLAEETLPSMALDPDEGVLRVVPKAFGAKAALIVGGTGDGLDRALEQVTERLPHIWERGKDRTTIDDVEMDLWKFISGRSPAGQAAAALYKLDRILERLDDRELRSARVLVSVEKPDAELEQVIRERARGLGVPEDSLAVVIDDRDVQNAETIFEDRFTVDSEVETFRKLFRERALPQVRGKDDVRVELRLSEPPEVLEALAQEIRGELGERAEVEVFSAYKQGYSWLYDIIRPKLEAAGAADITVRFARYSPPLEWSQQAMHTPLRWLHEAFPIDEILARELGLDLSAVRFEAATDDDAPPYEVIARDGAGAEVLREHFAPKLVLRPYIDRFRDYEMVNVTTGWLHIERAGETVMDQRIATDAERFWDHYQANTIPAMYDYVMDLHDGNPRGAGKDAPLFGELEVELTLSEPDYRLDLDQEIVSTMDALHEDIYFTTLMFYRILGRNARGEELTYPGRVLPIMTPKSDGTAGEARIRFSGFATHRPAVVVDYVTADGIEGSERLDIPKVETARPRALTAYVRAGTDGITKLELRVKVDTENDEREVFIERARSEQVDERILSAAQVVAMVENLSTLRDRGAYPETLAYHGLGELSVAAGWEHDIDWENEPRAVLTGGEPAPVPDVQRFASAQNTTELVQWDTPIPPSEAYGILAQMDGFDEATVYKVGESYLGQDVWAMDLMPPVEASHLSRYKATTLKPTVVYSARQHANEVSSTSHVLKLAELLLTEPDMREKLDRVNVVVHPITNPDGAQLAFDLYERTPDLILHAGYYASLGMDVTSDGSQPMPIYPESTLRRKIWNTWLPDIFLNPHGYPSHQLVQLFSEYTGLVRRGRITERNWSMNKGWFMPGFSYIDDPRFPRHKDAAFEIRDYITRAVGEAADVVAMNERNYDRYRRYGEHFDEDEVFKLPLVNDILIHTAIKGDRAPGPGASRGYNPKITIWSGTTEAPDETAYGDWMKLVATAGLQWDKAILQYLVDGDHQVERKGSSFFGGVSWSLDRPRPPKLHEDDEEDNENGNDSEVKP